VKISIKLNSKNNKVERNKYNEYYQIFEFPIDVNFEGNFKTIHSVKIDSNFSGIILSRNVVIINPISTLIEI
jgi:hypothetical protein